MTHVAHELVHVVESASERLRSVPEAGAGVRPAPGRWSKKEILGHLIDSAANNHQRFVRALHAASLVFPRYEQEEWVRLQGYDEGSWSELIELWRLYNRHLARVIERIPADRLDVVCTISPGEPVTLGYLVEDYLVHLKHHLGQIGVD